MYAFNLKSDPVFTDNKEQTFLDETGHWWDWMILVTETKMPYY